MYACDNWYDARPYAVASCSSSGVMVEERSPPRSGVVRIRWMIAVSLLSTATCRAMVSTGSLPLIRCVTVSGEGMPARYGGFSGCPGLATGMGGGAAACAGGGAVGRGAAAG